MENKRGGTHFSWKTFLYKLSPKGFLIVHTLLWFAAGLIVSGLLQSKVSVSPMAFAAFLALTAGYAGAVGILIRRN